MWILPLVSYVGFAVGFVFLTLSIASGLYYLSELVEEHTVLAKRTLVRLIYFVIALQLLLCVVDRFPVGYTTVGIISHVVYLGNMRRFPFVRMTDPLFLASCALVLLNHYFWMLHFSHAQEEAYHASASYYDKPDVPSFSQIAAYFGLCVWLVPFSLFVSLSAGDNVLPTMGTDQSRNSDQKNRRQGMAKAVVDSGRAIITETLRLFGSSRPGQRFE